MLSQDISSLLLQTYAPQVFSILTLMVAIAILIARQDQLGSRFGWAVGGFVVQLLRILVLPVVQNVIRTSSAEQGLAGSTVATYYMTLGAAGSILHAVSIVLLLIAILPQRPVQNTLPPELYR